jgi:hypothetical protein
VRYGLTRSSLTSISGPNKMNTSSTDHHLGSSSQTNAQRSPDTLVAWESTKSLQLRLTNMEMTLIAHLSFSFLNAPTYIVLPKLHVVN